MCGAVPARRLRPVTIPPPAPPVTSVRSSREASGVGARLRLLIRRSAIHYATRTISRTIPARRRRGRAAGGRARGRPPPTRARSLPTRPSLVPTRDEAGSAGAGASCHDFVFEKEHPPTHTATGSLNVLDTGPDTHTVTLSTPHSAPGLSTCRQSRALTRLEPLRLFDGVSKGCNERTELP